MPTIDALYVRAAPREVALFEARPGLLAALDLRGLVAEGRALDLGRAWDELGCLLEGGISTPSSGPTVGERPLASPAEWEVWNWIDAERVAVIARELAAIDRETFHRMYTVDDEDTADAFPEDYTGVWADRAEYLYRKLELLRDHYATAAARGESMLVRLGERLFERQSQPPRPLHG